MATTIYPDYDGVVYKYAGGTWNSIRNASSGALNTGTTFNMTNSHTSGRGGDTYNIGRYFLEFDTSSINKTISSASVQLYGNSTNALDVILMRGSQSGAVSTSDFMIFMVLLYICLLVMEQEQEDLQGLVLL